MNHCAKCQYDLTGLAQPALRCPECGATATDLIGPTRLDKLKPYLFMCGPCIPGFIILALTGPFWAALVFPIFGGPLLGATIAFSPPTDFPRHPWPRKSVAIAIGINGLLVTLTFYLVMGLFGVSC